MRLRPRPLPLCTLTLGLLLAPAASLAAPQAATVELELDRLGRLAEERYAEGDLAGAARLYEEIAAASNDRSSRAAALLTASWLLHLGGDDAPARERLAESLRLDPDQPFDSSLFNRDFERLYRQALEAAVRERQRQAGEAVQEALRELEADRPEAARRLLESALERAPDDPGALYNLALLDLRQGAGPEVLTRLERVVALTYGAEAGEAPSELRAKALTGIGIVYRRQQRPEDAERAFLDATRADPNEASAWKNLGLLRLERNDSGGSAAPLARAHELLPDDPEVTAAYARALAEGGRADQAAQLLQAELRKRPEAAGLWLELGRVEQLRAAPGEAAVALERALAHDPDNRAGVAALAAVRLAELQLEAGRHQQALEAANRALGWNRDSAAAWRALGSAQLATGETAPAVASLSRAAELEPAAVAVLIELAAAYAGDQQLQEAEAVLLRALSLEPGSAAITEDLAAVRRQLEQERAIVAGRVKVRKPIPPKKLGLEFASLDYKELHLRGALVKQVKHKSPAARAGLRKGDFILWIGDYEVLSDKDFYQYLKRNPPGDAFDIEYLRDGRIHETEIALR